MANLTLSYSDLYTRVSEFIGKGSSPTGDDLTLVKDIVHRGLRQFYYPTYTDPRTRKRKPYTWSFLKQYYSFTTVNNAWKYALPADYSEIITDLFFGTGSGYLPPRQRLPEQIIDLRTESDSNGTPEVYAIVPVKFDQEVGTFYEIWLYPTPDSAHLLQFFYKIDPLKPSATTDYLPGGVKSIEAILESCLAVAEQQEDDTIGIHTQRANNLIQELIVHDWAPVSDCLGNLYSGVREWPPERKNQTNLNIPDNIYADER